MPPGPTGPEGSRGTNSGWSAAVLREQLSAMLRSAGESGDQRAVATLRLIQAAIKERDHVARAGGRPDGVSEDDILAMLSTMVQQRREDITRCEESALLERAQQEADEIAVIEGLLPPQMGAEEIDAAIADAIALAGARKQKDTGRVMNVLKEHHPGQMDFALARRIVRARLGG
jgi:uncharacterized protein